MASRVCFVAGASRLWPAWAGGTLRAADGNVAPRRPAARGPYDAQSLPQRRCVAMARGPSTRPRDDVMKQVEAAGVPREVADRVLSIADRAVRDWSSIATEFMPPPEADALTAALSRLADVSVFAWGGYASAERRVLIVSRTDMAASAEDAIAAVRDDLSCVSVKGNFLFDAATHRDFMGAILNTGVSRQKVGDIIVLGDRGCQVVVSSDIVSFLEDALTSVRSVTVQAQAVPWDELDVRPPNIKELTIVEASMRLDAVASAGFSMSRSKFADAVRAGDCQVNYKPATTPSKSLKTGDVVSLRGKGKLEVGETSITAKGRNRIQVTRYV